MERIRDRADAGRRLAHELADVEGDHAVVLALPRGGVPVAAPIAEAIEAPLSVLVVRKLGVPGHEEYGFGALGEGGVRLLDAETVASLGLSDDAIDDVVAQETAELARRVAAYRDGRPLPDLKGKVAVLVDDGVATGGTMRAAIAVARELGAAEVVVAVGCAPPDTVATLRAEADDVVVMMTPEPFSAVGQWYEDFRQTTDEEVRELLTAAP